MALENSLNTACDLNEYLICKMPVGALEVQLKVKTTWGKFMMVQDTHTKMEKCHTWEKAQRSHIRSRKRRAPHKMTNKQTEDNASETDIPTGQGFRYPPQIFTNPTYTATTAHTESEGEVKQNRKFLGKYCKFCARCNETHCWCNSSDWEEELINIDKSNSNPSIKKIPSPTVRKPQIGWFTFRHRVVREAELARHPSLAEEAGTNSGIRMQ